MKTVYLIGLPGAGKTTVVDLALKLLDLQPVVEHIVPIPHVRHGTLWHLGRHRVPFGGTDTLALNINPKAVAFVKDLAFSAAMLDGLEKVPRIEGAVDPEVPAVLFGEGDRLANDSFFKACPNLTVVWLDTPLAQAREQARLRAEAQGVPVQNPSWWKGRVTKVSNLVNSRPVVRLDGRWPPATAAADLAALLAS